MISPFNTLQHTAMNSCLSLLTGLIRVWPLILVLLAAGCASTPKTSPPPPKDYAAQVVDYALSLEGAPYVYGKASPDEGFDCSGFVWHVYRHNGKSLPRTVEQMAQTLPTIELEERRPGDLLFFQTGAKPYSHVALYVGNEEFIHAPSSRTGHVMVSGLHQRYWRQRLTGVRRPVQ
jgi:cell wall-associated NlpC family hydrolase